jgi:glycosyltransferase involved in cell wall biosynthesis
VAPPPLVSVLVPTYNGEKYLREALDGIRDQTYRNIEVLVRDDCSTDGTEDIVSRYTFSDSRFHWIADGINHGSTGNMIELLKRANGNYIKVCNQDDVLATNCISRLMQPMLADPSITLSTSSRTLIDEAGRTLPGTLYTEPLTTTDQTIEGRRLARLLLVGGINRIGEPSTALFRNGVLEPDDTFIWDGHIYQVNNDIALWSKLLLRGNGHFTVEALSKFRRHGEMRSQDINEVLTGTMEWPRLFDSGLTHGIVGSAEDARIMCQHILFAFNALNSYIIKTYVDKPEPYLNRLALGVQDMQDVMTRNSDFIGLSLT